MAKTAPKPPKAAAAPDTSNDDLQRSRRLDTYTILADSGASRGENIYFYKCWMCHNQYAKSAPLLKDLYKRDSLSSGDPVNDDNVAAKIKEGGPGMPAFRTSLSDADISDLRRLFSLGKMLRGRRKSSGESLVSRRDAEMAGSERAHGRRHRNGADRQRRFPRGRRRPARRAERRSNHRVHRMRTANSNSRRCKPAPTPCAFQRRFHSSLIGEIRSRSMALRSSTTSCWKESPTRIICPPQPVLESQLSSAEILWNLPGTAEEKAMLQKNCSGCHSWQQIFRNRYDEHSWGLIVDRMMHFSGTAIAVRNKPMSAPDPEYNILVKFLSRVRGPDRKDDPLRVFPRPRGESTRVVVTEYELPQQLLALHDAAADSQGNIWFTSHKTRVVGKLDPKTGIVTEYKIPLTPGSMPGTHHAVIDKNGIAWISENWAHQLNRLDPKTGEVKQVLIESKTPINAPSFGNFTLDADGYVWDARADRIVKMDPNTGKVLQEWPLQADSSYDNTISYDGKYWGGSGPANWGNTVEMLDIETGKILNLNSGTHMMTAKRGGFDPFGNTWWGGADGALIELNAKAARIDEYCAADRPASLHRFLRSHAGQKRRGVGRRAARPANAAVQSQDQPLARLSDAGAVFL